MFFCESEARGRRCRDRLGNAVGFPSPGYRVPSLQGSLLRTEVLSESSWKPEANAQGRRSPLFKEPFGCLRNWGQGSSVE